MSWPSGEGKIMQTIKGLVIAREWWEEMNSTVFRAMKVHV
jgi:hypothetical protein